MGMDQLHEVNCTSLDCIPYRACIPPPENERRNRLAHDHASITARKSGKEQASLLLHNMTEPLLFEASLHASPNIKLTTEWNKSLTYSPRHAESDVVEFRFEATAPEPSFLVIDFYQERH